MTVCGLWATPQRLSAVLIDEAGHPRAPISSASTPEGCSALLAYLVTIGLDVVVLSERSHSLIEQALAVQLNLAIAPHDLLEAIRTAAGFTTRAPRYSATLLARWHTTPALRRHLRYLPKPNHQAPDPDQLPLL